VSEPGTDHKKMAHCLSLLTNDLTLSAPGHNFLTNELTLSVPTPDLLTGKLTMSVLAPFLIDE
jgi:hypothetical protein